MSWRLEALKITEKIILENTFEHEKNENRVKRNWPMNNWTQK